MTEKLIAGLLTILILSLAVQFIVANLFVGTGENLVLVDEEIETKRIQNTQLADAIVMKTSLAEIAKMAEELGLIKPEQIVYLTVDISIPIAAIRQ